MVVCTIMAAGVVNVIVDTIYMWTTLISEYNFRYKLNGTCIDLLSIQEVKMTVQK